MEMRCLSCANKWEATRLDAYILRCGFCEKLTCERCGRHDLARIHVCPDCYAHKGADLEDIFVGTCESCGWVRPVGVVGMGLNDTRSVCQYCREKGAPEKLPENDAAYAKENFQRRVKNYFPPVYKADPGTDLLPLTAEKFEKWDRAIEYDIRDRGIAQASFHKDAASVAGLLKLFEMNGYNLSKIAPALGRINEPEGNNFLLHQVNSLNEEPYNARLALEGLCETPGEVALSAVIWLIDHGHFSVTPVFGLELLLKLEFLQPGFLFQPEVIREINLSLESISYQGVPQHLMYFRRALDYI